MSQSEAHKGLVEDTAQALAIRFPGISLSVDLQKSPGDEIPPLIGNFRPDIYAKLPKLDMIIIAEAKTDRDIDNWHTHAQIRAFITYMNDLQGEGKLILAVAGNSANSAKTLMRFIFSEITVTDMHIEVYDGLDFWMLDVEAGRQWRLI